MLLSRRAISAPTQITITPKQYDTACMCMPVCVYGKERGRRTEKERKQAKKIGTWHILHICLCSCLQIAYFSPYFNTSNCIIYHPTFLTTLSSENPFNTSFGRFCITHLCSFLMSAIHHEPEGNTESINSDM